MKLTPPNRKNYYPFCRLKKASEKILISEAELYGSLIHVFTPQTKKTVREINTTAKDAGIKIESIAVVDPTLEDVFIACMREN